MSEMGIVAEVQYKMLDGTVYALGAKREDCETDDQFLQLVRKLGQTLEDDITIKLGVTKLVEGGK